MRRTGHAPDSTKQPTLPAAGADSGKRSHDNEELAALFAHPHLQIAVLDRAFNILRVNAAYADGCGMRPEAMVGLSHRALFPDTGDEAILRRVADSGIAHTESARFIDHPCLGPTWWDWTLAPLTGGRGEVNGLLLSMYDVTEHEHTRQALEASRERFDLAMTGSNEGLWDWNLVSGEIYVSPRWCELFGTGGDGGRSPEAVWRESLHPDDRETVRRRLNDFIAGDGSFYESIYRIHRPGGERWIVDRALAIRDAQGNATRLVGTNMDITRRKRAEQEVEGLRRLYQVLSEANKAIARLPERDALLAEICRILVDYGGFRTVWIGAYDRRAGCIEPVALAGAATDYFRQVRLLEADPLHSRGPGVRAVQNGRPVIVNDILADEVVRAILGKVLEHGHRSLGVFPLREAERTFGFVAAYAAEPAFFDEPRIGLLSGLADDVSFALDSLLQQRAHLAAERALRRAHDELEDRVLQRTAELEASNRQLESFSYSVSHDLRAPLRAINGFSGILAEEWERIGEGEARDCLDRIRAASLRMDQLIDGLLGLSRIAARELVRQPLDLADVAREVIAELRRTAPERSVDILCPERLPVNADPYLARIALDNLLGNAWKFTSRNRHARIELGVAEGGREFFVSDDGIGFDMAYADKLFGPFQRLHSDEAFPGTGIGLATVARTIAAHGGRIRADGEPGRGATFRFTLAPADAQSAGEQR